MKKKKNVAVLLMSGLIFCTAALSACGGKSVPYDPDNFLPEGTAENPYQIVKEAVTLNIFVPRGSLNPPYESMEMFKILSELTNLKFDFTEVDTSAYTSVRSAAWEDKKNLPDLFLFNNSISEQVIYSQYGALVAFNDDNLEAGGVKEILSITICPCINNCLTPTSTLKLPRAPKRSLCSKTDICIRRFPSTMCRGI